MTPKKKSPLKRLWNWSWVVTLPLGIVWALWLGAVQDRYDHYGVRRGDALGSPGMLHPIMQLEWKQLLRHTRSALRSPDKDGESGIPQVHLFIDGKDEKKLNKSLPESGRKPVDGKLVYPDGSIGKAELRYRGDFQWHWSQPKKSWRVKTKKSNLWHGIRKFNLIVPKSPALAEGHLGYWLAGQMGLLTPQSDVVEVKINGANRGLHTFVEQPDESLLRRLGRMPVDLWEGEVVGRDAYPGRPTALFDSPGVWQKAAIFNQDEDNRDPLIHLCQTLDSIDSEHRAEELRRVVGSESMAAFTAYRILCQSGHYDDNHNWRLMYDPWRMLWEPLVWDPNAWHPRWAPSETRPEFEWPAFAKLDRVLALDHSFRFEVHQEIVRFMEQGLDKKLIEEWSQYREKLRPAAERDPDLTMFFVSYGMELVDAESDRFDARVRRFLDHARAVHVDAPISARANQLVLEAGRFDVRLEIDGWRPAAGLEIQFEGEIPAGMRWTLVEEGVPTPRIMNLDPWVQTTDKGITLDRPFLSAATVESQKGDVLFRYGVSVRPTTYLLRAEWESGEGVRPMAIACKTSTGGTQPIDWVSDIPVADHAGQWGIYLPTLPGPPSTLSGEVTIQGVQEYPNGLTIAPGTTVRMGPDASLIVEGPFEASGTKENPIQFVADEGKKKPWGTVAIRGAAADGATLRHVSFQHGSGFRNKHQVFTGLLSIHDVDDVKIEDCSFTKNYVVDDMVHTVYAENFSMERCSFVSARMDALDLDMSWGRIADCTFTKSGNDGIDLMTSRFVVTGCSMAYSGDKGISVGERSVLRVEDSRLTENAVGIQGKDESYIWATRCHFESTTSDVSLIKKNWRYGNGGSAMVERCQFPMGAKVEVAKRSRLYVEDTHELDELREQKRVKAIKGAPSQFKWAGKESFQEPLFLPE